MAPALRMTRSIKEKLKIFPSPGDQAQQRPIVFDDFFSSHLLLIELPSLET